MWTVQDYINANNVRPSEQGYARAWIQDMLDTAFRKQRLSDYTIGLATQGKSYALYGESHSGEYLYDPRLLSPRALSFNPNMPGKVYSSIDSSAGNVAASKINTTAQLQALKQWSLGNASASGGMP